MRGGRGWGGRDRKRQRKRQIHRERERERERQRQRQRQRQTDRQTDRQTYRQTDRDRDRQTDRQTDRPTKTNRPTDRDRDIQRQRQKPTGSVQAHRDGQRPRKRAKYSAEQLQYRKTDRLLFVRGFILQTPNVHWLFCEMVERTDQELLQSQNKAWTL